jgi:signal transduction histidine kinase
MSLFRKILLAMLCLALVPLLASSLLLSSNLGKVRDRLAAEISATADQEASESLKLRAEQVASTISAFLEECEGDIRLLAALPMDQSILRSFYESRQGEIWYKSGTEDQPREMREYIPRYSSLDLIDRDGKERFVIRNSRILPARELKNVANPSNTEFRSEEYFSRTSHLKKGEIYVSHLTGFHISKEEQLAGAAEPEEAYNGKQYRGVVRFATPLFDRRGGFNGIAVLSLDHRHLMEFSQHILPGKSTETVFPSYKSGNYAFIFDDEGWIITHPKYWDLRGVDKNGKLVPPYSVNSSKEDIESGRIPYNLDYAGFIHPNYPQVARQAREEQSGYVDITNVGGARKIMAFAPIHYNTGDYGRHGIFGAVTIGFQVDQFHELARTGVALLTRELQKHITTSVLIVTITSLLVVACAWALSRGITRPLALLTEGARRLASGSSDSRVVVESSDELGELADTFNKMGAELELRKNNLLNTLDELSASRHEIMEQRNFKESVLESISSAIMTISTDGTLTSINSTGRKFLGEKALPGSHYSQLFDGWDDMGARIEAVLEGRHGYGREPLVVGGDDKRRFFEVGFFPIGVGADQGITVTMRDETEKEQMHEEMTRMDRLASLGKLSAGIAHEVRNPLTGISLLLDDLHDRAALDQESQKLMARALSEIERVERLVAALLNFAAPPKTDFRIGDLNLVVQETLLLLHRECERHGVELRYTTGDIPPCRFDAERIKQALLNLVKNALEAVGSGGIIQVSTAAENGMVTITVADNGQGISPADLPLIFEPFFTRKGAGTGLGLSITQRIVTEHNGRIAVESGNGTRFTITLPLPPAVA